MGPTHATLEGIVELVSEPVGDGVSSVSYQGRRSIVLIVNLIDSTTHRMEHELVVLGLFIRRGCDTDRVVGFELVIRAKR